MRSLNRRFCVAPMMGYTHRHARYLFRLLSKEAVLYTEMVTTGALLRGNQRHLLDYHPDEHPLALQLGGSNPADLARCAKMAEDLGYDEINLNMGCPSHKVKSGAFGACLMAQPELAQDIVQTIKQQLSIPLTVKCRIGIDDQDIDRDLHRFVQALVEASVDGLIVHARKAWLHGINPRANRRLPPLNYARVHQLKQEFPDLPVIINGGIQTLEQAIEHLEHLDGVMLGRQIAKYPLLLSEVDALIFKARYTKVDLKACLEKYVIYAENQLQQGASATKVLQPVLGFFHGIPKAKYWRGLLCAPHQTAQEAMFALTTAIQNL